MGNDLKKLINNEDKYEEVKHQTEDFLSEIEEIKDMNSELEEFSLDRAIKMIIDLKTKFINEGDFSDERTLGLKYAMILGIDAVLHMFKAFKGAPGKIDMTKDECNREMSNAAMYGNVERVQQMLDAGADDYNWAMRRATTNGHPDIVQMMLDAGANCYNEVMGLAAIYGYPEIVKMMLDAGADGYNGAIQFAAAYGHTEIISIIKKHMEAKK